LLHRIEPNFNAPVYCHRLRHARPNNTCFAVRRSLNEILVLCQEKDLFLLEAGDDLSVVNASIG
jgi:hypothetical protein